MFHKHTLFPVRKEVDPCFTLHTVKKLVRRQLLYSYLFDVINQSAHIEPKFRITGEKRIANDLKEKTATEFQIFSGILLGGNKKVVIISDLMVEINPYRTNVENRVSS